jgi:molecular chaperone GrpE
MSDEAIETTRDSVRPSNEERGADGVIEPANGETVLVEELAALREKAAEADALRDQYLRCKADLENFRKRAARERQEAIEFANQGFFEKLMPVLDNLEMAQAAVNAAQGDQVESLKTGVEMVLGQLSTVLREAGLQEIDAQGQAFDPAWHEAVAQQETAEAPEGRVVHQLRKGYRLHQRLLRPASVVVARAPQV